MTVIPERAAIAPGTPAGFEAKRPMDCLRQVLRRLGCDGVVVGGLDGTYELPADEWQLHFHLLAPARPRPGPRSWR